jgi:thiamine-phosphate pyrophosphorylase
VTSPAPTPLRASRRVLLRDAGVYLVTEEALSGGRSTVEVAQAALEAGVRVVQLREKEGSARRALEIGRALRALTLQHGALLIVNDRVDLALAIGADGVHVGQEDLPVAVVRLLLGPDAHVGLSITHADQLAGADAADADCLGVGAVFPTGSKADATDTGLALLTRARASTAAPIVAIGGITIANAGEAVRAGADVLAVISAITAAADPAAAARALLDAVAKARAAADAQAAAEATPASAEAQATSGNRSAAGQSARR